ncbi:MAG: acetyl-CoA carboxylase biotin carboxyl carrier protein [Ignavibacteria bacterium]
MDLKYLQKVIKMLDSSELAEIEIEEEGTKLRLSKPRPKVFSGMAQMVAQPLAAPLQQSAPAVTVSTEKTEEKLGENLYEVRSPMVGTFYRTPSPDADPYVKPGDSVKTGDVICIIEAMKLMNEIESEVSGKVVKLLVENGTAVEYDQPLMLIEKD